MANEQDKNPTTDQDKDISKSQAAQQPTGQQNQAEQSQFKDESLSSEELGGDRAETGQDTAGTEELPGDTLSQQRTDVEGTSQFKEKGEAESGFVGSQGQQDTSSELVDEDEDEDFARGGQGAPEDE